MVSAQRRREIDSLAPHEQWVLANPEYERARLIDGSGRVITQKEGGRAGVEWTVEALEPLIGRVDLILHNHPGGRSVGEDDLALAIYLRAREVDAVTRHRRYRLLRAGGEWPEPYELAKVVSEEQDRLTREMIAARANGQIDDPGIELTFHHVLWQRVSARYLDRVSYEVEERE